MEGKFPRTGDRGGGGFGMIQVHYIQAHFLPGGPFPDRLGPVPVHGLEVGDP